MAATTRAAAWTVLVAASLALTAPNPLARADDSPQQVLADAVWAYTELVPMPGGAALDAAQAAEVQRMLIMTLRPRFGEIAGYKAALTSPAAQQRFGVDAPLTGVLLENMFTSTGSIVDRGAFVRPVLEADLLVRVGDAAINDARNEDEVLAALSEVIPAIEIADLMYADPSTLDGPAITAINAGARLMVVGPPIALSATGQARDRLARFTAGVVDQNGATVTGGAGAALMGHPLSAAAWLKNEVLRQGYRLKPGDLLSLGSLGPPVPLAGLERVTATYEGLDGEPLEIHVGFR